MTLKERYLKIAMWGIFAYFYSQILILILKDCFFSEGVDKCMVLDITVPYVVDFLMWTV